MHRKQTVVLMVCAGLVGCEVGSSRELMAPDDGGVALQRVVRADGGVIAAPRTHPQARVRMRPSAGPTAAVVTTCDAGIIDPADGSPEGGLDGGTYDDVEVPPGKICVLSDATVINSVRALAGARLFIRGTQIGGNVEGLAASSIQVSDETAIAGNMTVLNADDTFFASCAVDNATIVGNLTCEGNNPGSPVIRAEQGPTVIGGTVNLVDNVIPAGHVLLLLNSSIGAGEVNNNGGPGHKEVTGNSVTGRLSCKRNATTFIGGPNTAGKAKVQCF